METPQAAAATPAPPAPPTQPSEISAAVTPIAAPISASATQQSSLPVAWQQAGLTERPRDPPAPAPAVTPPTMDQAPMSPHPADQPPPSTLPEQKKRPASELRDPSLEGLLEATPARRSA